SKAHRTRQSRKYISWLSGCRRGTLVSTSSRDIAIKETFGCSLRRLGRVMERKLWAEKISDLSVSLQRKFWKPLRNTVDCFHVLPLLAAVVLFVLLAGSGQLRELYISYLEYPSDGVAAASIRITAGLIAIALLSAALFEAHNALSTTRGNLVFSDRSDPAANYRRRRLRQVQRAAAFTLAFTPWLGITIGLFGARNFVA